MKVLLVDDHPLILAALRTVIQGLGDHVEVVGAASGRAAREALVASDDYDLVLLDLQLGDVDGLEMLVELRGAYPALPVVVLSASDVAANVLRAIDLGAMGFVPKRSSNETLFEALRIVMSGGIYVPPLADGAGGHVDGGIGSDRPGAMPSPAVAAARLDATRQAVGEAEAAARPPTLADLGLTPRQTDVLGLLLKGLPNKLIARELDLSVETVKDHVAAVLRALSVDSRTKAVVAVSRLMQGAEGPAPWQSKPPASR